MGRPVYSEQGKVVLITGAARGIGAAAARRLVQGGANVSLVGLEPQQLRELADELGAPAMWVEADVTDRDAIARAAAQTVERFGRLDVVIANAGIGVAGSVRLIDPEAFERVIEVNLLGVWRTVRACLPYVVERRGYVLAIASAAAFVHAPGMASYTASKAGVEAFADALRAELRHLGVDVGVAYFSWMDTDLVRGTDEHPVYGRARARLKGPGSRTYPVSVAVDAILRGIQRRSAVVVAPPWMRAALLARGLIRPLVDRAARARFAEIEALAEEELHRDGESSVSPPAGPGGAAAMAARR